MGTSNNYINVSIRFKICIFLELGFAAFFIFRALMRVRYNLKKGFFRICYARSNYFYILRMFVLLYLTFIMLNFEGQVCFCKYRAYFYEHCYFDQIDYKQYLCYSTKSKQEWMSKAVEIFYHFYPDSTFDVLQRTVYTCIQS